MSKVARCSEQADEINATTLVLPMRALEA